MELERIKKLVNNYYGVDIDVNSRKREICMPRQVYCYLARNVRVNHKYVYPFTKIASGVKAINNHATVIHSINLISDLIKYDKKLRNEVMYLRGLIDYKFITK